MFSALHHTSVLLVLCWLVVGEQFIQAGASYLVSGVQPSQEARTLLSVAGGATGMVCVCVCVYVCACVGACLRVRVYLYFGTTTNQRIPLCHV